MLEFRPGPTYIDHCGSFHRRLPQHQPRLLHHGILICHLKKAKGKVIHAATDLEPKLGGTESIGRDSLACYNKHCSNIQIWFIEFSSTSSDRKKTLLIFLPRREFPTNFPHILSNH